MPGSVVESKKFEPVNKEAEYLRTVLQLRARNFSRNLPFLILSEKLPDGQVYREFPDGRMEVQQIASPSFRFEFIRELSSSEADRIRKEYGLR